MVTTLWNQVPDPLSGSEGSCYRGNGPGARREARGGSIPFRSQKNGGRTQETVSSLNPWFSAERAVVEPALVIVALHPATPRCFAGW